MQMINAPSRADSAAQTQPFNLLGIASQLKQDKKRREDYTGAGPRRRGGEGERWSKGGGSAPERRGRGLV